MQLHLPAISSPLVPSKSQKGRRSLWLSSPKASVRNTPTPSQLSPPPAPTVGTQSLNLSDPSPSAPAVSTQAPRTERLISSAPSANVQSPSITLGSTISPQHGLPSLPNASEQPPSAMTSAISGQSSRQDSVSVTETGEESRCPHPQVVQPSASASTDSPNLVPELIQRPVSYSLVLGGPVLTSAQLNLPPGPTSTFTSGVQARPTMPTPVLRPRRPLCIVSRQHGNSGVEYQVHWNNGRNSWEPHDSLYRDYPALIQKFSEGRR